MSIYAAPLRDMQFVIKELVGLDDIAALPGCEEVTPDLVDAVLEEAGKFATGVLDPLNRPGDQHGAKLETASRDHAAGLQGCLRQFSRGGWTGLSCDPHYRRPGIAALVSAHACRRCGTAPTWRSACARC